MQNKKERLLEIKRIVSSNYITKQEELLKLLNLKGYDITQATLSRDLKELNVGTKYVENIGNVYFFPEEKNITYDVPSAIDAIVSLEISGSLGVLKTLPGFANGVAAIVDNKKIDTIAGTIAGNDTILIVIKENVTKQEFIDSLTTKFSNIIKVLKP